MSKKMNHLPKFFIQNFIQKSWANGARLNQSTDLNVSIFKTQVSIFVKIEKFTEPEDEEFISQSDGNDKDYEVM